MKMTTLKQVYNAIFDHGGGSTRTITAATGLSYKTVSARIVELFRMGSIEATGRFSPTGGNLWKAVKAEVKKPPRRPVKLKEPKEPKHVEPLGPKDGGYLL